MTRKSSQALVDRAFRAVAGAEAGGTWHRMMAGRGQRQHPERYLVAVTLTNDLHKWGRNCRNLLKGTVSTKVATLIEKIAVEIESLLEELDHCAPAPADNPGYDNIRQLMQTPLMDSCSGAGE